LVVACRLSREDAIVVRRIVEVVGVVGVDETSEGHGELFGILRPRRPSDGQRQRQTKNDRSHELLLPGFNRIVVRHSLLTLHFLTPMLPNLNPRVAPAAALPCVSAGGAWPMSCSLSESGKGAAHGKSRCCVHTERGVRGGAGESRVP